MTINDTNVDNQANVNKDGFAKDVLAVSNEIDEEVCKATKDVINLAISLFDPTLLKEAIANAVITELDKSSFMTMQLELTEEQKEILRACSNSLADRVIENYKSQTSLKKEASSTEKKVQDVSQNILAKVKYIANQSIIAVGNALKRGVSIPSKIEQCDVSKDKSTMRLCFFGDSKVTVPASVVFLSTNASDIIQHSIDKALVW